MNPTVYENLQNLTMTELLNAYQTMIQNIEKLKQHFGTSEIHSAYLVALAQEIDRRQMQWVN